MDKHRSDSVGPQDVHFMLLDDYLHVVDTALWLNLLYVERSFLYGEGLLTTATHRQAAVSRKPSPP
ncbi:hypothetical protein [Sodalis sp.]|uniref:hypothetical protein n=1 Tax=Sodalis sp. (in: enterobacteria) TaxID=1898979 RepID=UPI003872B2A4